MQQPYSYTIPDTHDNSGNITHPTQSLYISPPQSLEGTYRALHSRLRANAESVALYGGMGKESRTVSRGFDAATSQVAAVQRTQWRFGMVQDFFLKYLGATAAVILVIGPFFSGHLRRVCYCLVVTIVIINVACYGHFRRGGRVRTSTSH